MTQMMNDTSNSKTADVVMSKEEMLQHYIDAAWQFGNALLWKGEEHPDEEERAALAELDHYFRNADDPKEAFVHFVGRVMVAESTKQRCPILSPIRWLHRANNEGLMLMKMDPKVYASVLKKVPLFETLTRIIAKHFLEFIKCPTVKTVLACSDELQAQGGKGWMRIFYQ